jgi:hypothetical protein
MQAFPRGFSSLFGYLKAFTMGLLVSAIPFHASADIYTWKDPSGQVHFADRPQPSYAARNLNPPVAFGYVSEPLNQPSDQDLSDTRNVAETPQESTQMDSADELTFTSIPPAAMGPDRSVCAAAQRQLSNLKRFQRLRVKNEAGKDVFLSQQEKQVFIDDTMVRIKQHCD